MDFPAFLSLTVTNACNLRCQMCGQWSEGGYMRTAPQNHAPAMGVSDWKRLVDEARAHGTTFVLIRGGEPFLMPGIMDLLEHIAALGMSTAIDSNGTCLVKYADDLVRLGNAHITVSVDGPQPIHDAVRGVPGAYQQIVEGLSAIKAAEDRHGRTISKSITFTISPWSYRGLGNMPDVARALGVPCLCIVPYFYMTEALGLAYERELRDEFHTRVFSWRGFEHESSGIDLDVFRDQLAIYRANLGTLKDYPYLPLSLDEYRTWFASPDAPVGAMACPNAERCLDIQPTGEANCCVDFPDYGFGNVREQSLAALWNSPRAQRFRERRRERCLSCCHRCGAKYMAAIRDA